MINNTQNISQNQSQDVPNQSDNEGSVISLLEDLFPTNSLTKSQFYRVQLTMGQQCILICAGVCRLYLSDQKENKWIYSNIEGALIVCIDKDQNYAAFLRILDLNTFTIKFEMEMFKTFEKCLQFSNSQFLLINVPMIAQNYFGISFGNVEDANLIHRVIIVITKIEDLSQICSLPNIQNLLVKRNLAFQFKGVYEKEGKQTKQPAQDSLNAVNKYNATLQQQGQQNTQILSKPLNIQQQTSFWGDQNMALNNGEIIQDGKVSDYPLKLSSNSSGYQPNNTQKSDTFYGNHSQILMNDKNSQSLNQSINRNGDEQKSNKILNTNNFVQPSQSQVFNINPQTSQMKKTQTTQAKTSYGIDVNSKLINSDKTLISNNGYNENSQSYDISKIDPNLRDIIQKAGIQPQELSSSAYAPMIRSIINQAEQRKSLVQSRVDINQNQQKLTPSSNISMMPQGSIADKITTQAPYVVKVNQNDSQSQILKGSQFNNVIRQDEANKQDFNLSANDKQELTNLLHHAMEDRRQQIQKNMFDSEEKSSWENDESHK